MNESILKAFENIEKTAQTDLPKPSKSLEGVNKGSEVPFYRQIKDIVDSGYSEKVIESIQSPEELQLYKDLGLRESEVNGRTVLVRDDIDPNMKDQFGMTNVERTKEGKAALGNDGAPTELHHIGQRHDSPLAELTQTEHRKYYSDLHSSLVKKSDIDRSLFDTERMNHWEERSKDFEKGVING
ncbi:MAG: HNH/ENDO VII family nuclease [Candidatus Cloacimonadaceae bacterium]|jgi:hypothetical protein